MLRPRPLPTTSIDADCLPRESPPASSPALRAAKSLSARSPCVASKARPMASGTCGPTRMLPCADQVLPWRSPAQLGVASVWRVGSTGLAVARRPGAGDELTYWYMDVHT